MDLQRIFIIILILVILGGGYYYLSSSFSSSFAPPSAASIAELEARLNEIRSLQSLEIDTSIFDNPFFHSLAILPPAPPIKVLPGRLNPFAPLSENRDQGPVVNKNK